MEEKKEVMQISNNQLQVHKILFNREIGWKEILLDLINTEQLNPWDIDISILAESYLARIEEYEKLDFFISSKVLMAASLLLRLKSEFVLERYIRSIDDVLFGREENSEKKESLEEFLDFEDNVPELISNTPVPRFRKITLNELIDSLNKAIVTENRRIKKTIVNQNALRQAGIALPKREFEITSKIKSLHSKLIAHFDAYKSHKKISYTRFIGEEKENRPLSFYPLLQLESNGKIWLEQESHFGEIHIWLKNVFIKSNGDPFQELKMEFNELNDKEKEKLEEVQNIENLF